MDTVSLAGRTKRGTLISGKFRFIAEEGYGLVDEPAASVSQFVVPLLGFAI